jgi:hypothetical protein
MDSALYSSFISPIRVILLHMQTGNRQDEIMRKVMDRPDIDKVWDSKEVEDAILKLL